MTTTRKQKKLEEHLDVDYFGRRAHFVRIEAKIQSRHRDGKRIRVGFFVLYDSAFPALGIARALRLDRRFEPVIVLIPDTLRGRKNMMEQLRKSHASFSHEGVAIVSGYDESADSFVDIADELDFVCISNPYDELTHEYFKMSYLRNKEVLPFFISYGFSLSRFHRSIIERDSFRYFWRIFVPTQHNQADYHQQASAPPEIVVITGYPKMDGLESAKPEPSSRPMVIIAPHHTVREWPGGLELSTFLTLSEFFAELPKLYPDIDFVFRPHPLLFVHLAEDDLWGAEKSSKYLSDLARNFNVTIDSSNDYLETFARSSALIHDSVSFSAEYLFTGRPALFLSEPERDPSQQFGRLGEACLMHHYHATSTTSILEFIDDVVLGRHDPMKRGRTRFARTVLMRHHPRAGVRVVKHLTRVVKRRRSSQ